MLSAMVTESGWQRIKLKLPPPLLASRTSAAIEVSKQTHAVDWKAHPLAQSPVR